MAWVEGPTVVEFTESHGLVTNRIYSYIGDVWNTDILKISHTCLNHYENCLVEGTYVGDNRHNDTSADAKGRVDAMEVVLLRGEYMVFADTSHAQAVVLKN